MAQQQSFMSESPAQAQSGHNTLQTYLDTLEKPVAPLGAEKSADWRQEAEAHLYALVAAHIELGSSYDEAVSAALMQFGNGRRVGNQVALEVRKQSRVPLSEASKAVNRRIEFAVFPLVIGIASLGPLSMIYNSDGSSIYRALAQAAAVFLFLCVPLAGGWNWGPLLSPDWKHFHAIKITPRMRLAIALGAYLAYGLVSGTVYSVLFDHHFGADSLLDAPSLIVMLLYPILALISMQAQKRWDATHHQGAIAG